MAAIHVFVGAVSLCVLAACDNSAQPGSMLAVSSSDPCQRFKGSKLGSLTIIDVGPFKTFRASDTPCAAASRGASKASGNGLGLLGDTGKAKSQPARPGTVILVGYGNDQLDQWGSEAIVQGDKGQLQRVPTGYTNEAVVGDNLRAAGESLERDGVHSLVLYNQSQQQIEQAVAADRQANPAAYATAPFVAVHGHGTNDMQPDGSHSTVMTNIVGNPAALKTTDTLAAVGRGLGPDSAFCAGVFACFSGNTPNEIAQDPRLKDQVNASVASSASNEVSFSAKGSQAENGLYNLVNGFNGEQASQVDPTQDGTYTLADYLQANKTTQVDIGRVDQLFIQQRDPFGKPLVDANGAARGSWAPVEDKTQPPNPVAATGAPQTEYSPQYGTWESVSNVTYEQNLQSGGDPSRVILSRYTPMPTGADAFAPDPAGGDAGFAPTTAGAEDPTGYGGAVGEPAGYGGAVGEPSGYGEAAGEGEWGE
jgi:hypothetical protein